MIREANQTDLKELLQLYMFLHETNIPEDSEQLIKTWDSIISDEIIILSYMKQMENCGILCLRNYS